MSERDATRTLILIRRSPYGSSLARAAIETGLALAAFDQPCNLLFVGDGVLQLLPGQDPGPVGLRNLGKLLQSLPLYDIEHVYVDNASAQRYGVAEDDLPLQVDMLSTADVQKLLSEHDQLLGF
ncbi:MAG: sulfurtransferase complex subunit TusC [Pseudomonadota bacterium]